MSECVLDKLAHSLHGQFTNVYPVTAFQNNPAPLVSQCSSISLITSTSLPEPYNNSKELGNLSGSGVSRLVRRLPFVPVFDRGVGRRRTRRFARRVFTSRVQPAPGMKRKNSSNTFISCYPLWKRRVPFALVDKVYQVIDCGRWSSNSFANNKLIH